MVTSSVCRCLWVIFWGDEPLTLPLSQVCSPTCVSVVVVPEWRRRSKPRTLFRLFKISRISLFSSLASFSLSREKKRKGKQRSLSNLSKGCVAGSREQHGPFNRGLLLYSFGHRDVSASHVFLSFFLSFFLPFCTYTHIGGLHSFRLFRCLFFCLVGQRATPAVKANMAVLYRPRPKEQKKSDGSRPEQR